MTIADETITYQPKFWPKVTVWVKPNVPGRIVNFKRTNKEMGGDAPPMSKNLIDRITK